MALSKGCTIGLIIGLIVLAVIIIGIILLFVYGDKVRDWGVDKMIDSTEAEIVANLPEGYTEELVHDIMDDLRASLKSGGLNPDQIQELMTTYQAVIADKEIDAEEGADLLEQIQELLGREPVVPTEPEEELPDTLQAVPDSV